MREIIRWYLPANDLLGKKSFTTCFRNHAAINGYLHAMFHTISPSLCDIMRIASTRAIQSSLEMRRRNLDLAALFPE